jgi:hypothetical protein
VSATVEGSTSSVIVSALLGILGPSCGAGVTDSRFDRGDLLRVVTGEQRAELPDLLVLAHGTILRLNPWLSKRLAFPPWGGMSMFLAGRWKALQWAFLFSLARDPRVVGITQSCDVRRRRPHRSWD